MTAAVLEIAALVALVGVLLFLGSEAIAGLGHRGGGRE